MKTNWTQWIKTHKPEAALGGGALGLTVYLALKARTANASGTSSAANQSTAYPASSVLPVSTADTTQSDAFSGIEDQVVGLQSALLALQSPTTPAASGFPAAPAGQSVGSNLPTQVAPPPAAPTSAGYGEVDTAQGPMDWLGVWGSPTYQVGGGAPVYFGNSGSLAQGNPQPGEDVYTPVGYSSLVSAKPS
ncbi:MAG TPA: hypothetical protein VGR90_09225 [Acidimicrobiales bacterium]|nr:hypothetical protein [Acidimicrobiales bacterium]